jgi:hypothetical protein
MLLGPCITYCGHVSKSFIDRDFAIPKIYRSLRERIRAEIDKYSRPWILAIGDSESDSLEIIMAMPQTWVDEVSYS